MQNKYTKDTTPKQISKVQDYSSDEEQYNYGNKHQSSDESDLEDLKNDSDLNLRVSKGIC